MLTFKTMIKKFQYDRLIVRICFVFLSLCFWGLNYPFHLAYQEQFQLFLFTPDYWMDKCAHPGGFGEYVAEFLTQFYYYKWVGALVVTALLLIVQVLVRLLTLHLGRLKGVALDWYYVSYLPSLAAWVFLCDENNMLAGIVSLILVLMATWGYVNWQKPALRLLYAFRKASIPISNSLVRKVTLLYLRHSHFVAPTISVKYKSSAN